MFQYLPHDFHPPGQIIDIRLPLGEVPDGARTLGRVNRRIGVHTLVHVFGRMVEHPEHRENPVGRAVGAGDIRPRRPDVMDMEANPPRPLGNHRTVLEGVIDTLDTVRLHRNQVAILGHEPLHRVGMVRLHPQGEDLRLGVGGEVGRVGEDREHPEEGITLMDPVGDVGVHREVRLDIIQGEERLVVQVVHPAQGVQVVREGRRPPRGPAPEEAPDPVGRVLIEHRREGLDLTKPLDEIVGHRGMGVPHLHPGFAVVTEGMGVVRAPHVLFHRDIPKHPVNFLKTELDGLLVVVGEDHRHARRGVGVGHQPSRGIHRQLLGGGGGLGRVRIHIVTIPEPQSEKFHDFRVDLEFRPLGHLGLLAVLRDHDIIVLGQVLHRFPLHRLGRVMIHIHLMVLGHGDGAGLMDLEGEEPALAQAVGMELGDGLDLTGVGDDMVRGEYLLDGHWTTSGVDDGTPGEAGRHLRAEQGRVENRRRGMDKILLGDGLVGLPDLLEVRPVDLYREPEPGVLWALASLGGLTPEEVAPVQGLEGEIVERIVPGIVTHGVKSLGMLHDNIIVLGGDHGGRLAPDIRIGLQLLDGLGKRREGRFMVVRDDEAAS